MSKKKVIILSIVLILSIAYISRVAYINIVYGPIEVTQYSVGDKVKICNYQYQVSDYKFLSQDEYEKKYGELIDDEYDYDDHMFIIVEVKCKKLSDKYKKNFEFSPTGFKVQSKTISAVFDLDLFYQIMPDDYKKIEKAGDSNTVILPYVFAKSTLTEEHWKNFKNLDFKLSLNDAENKKIEINLKK